MTWPRSTTKKVLAIGDVRSRNASTAAARDAASIAATSFSCCKDSTACRCRSKDCRPSHRNAPMGATMVAM